MNNTNDATYWLKTRDYLITFFVSSEGVTVRYESLLTAQDNVSFRLTQDEARSEWLGLISSGAVQCDIPIGPSTKQFFA